MSAAPQELRPALIRGPVETHCSECGHEWTQHHTGYDTRARDDGPPVCYAFEPTTHGPCGCRTTPEKSYYRALQTEREMHSAWRKRAEEAEAALEESVKLQSHYAALLNEYDGGQRLVFPDASAWLARLRAT